MTLSGPAPSRLGELTVLDWIGAAVAAFTALALLAFPLVGRSFATIFRDLGTRDGLPLLTRVVLSGWLPVGLGALVAGGIALGVWMRGSLGVRRAILVGCFLLGAAAIALCVVAMYLPVFELAGNIK